MADEVTIAAMQPELGAPGFGDDGGRLARGVAREALPQGGAVTIVPGGFDQDAAGVAIAGLVRAPRRWRSPEEYSLGTRPR